MKLGSLKGGRDGRLVVVSRDLAWCADATHIAPTLQAALDDWERIAPQLENLSTDLAHEAIPMMRFHERHAEAPLPRAFQRAGLVVQAGGNDLQPAPQMYLGVSDHFLAPRGNVERSTEHWKCGFGAEIVVVIGDVAQGASPAQALAAVRLVGLANAITFHAPAEDGAAHDPVALQAGALTALSPVLVTPDELADAWREGTLHGTLLVDLNEQPSSRIEAGAGKTVDFGTLIAHLARTRDLRAGGVIGSGPLTDGSAAPVLEPGSTVRIRMDDNHGHAIFGTMEQTLAG